MGTPLAICICEIFLGGMLAAAAVGLSWRLAPERERPGVRRWLVGWSLKGLLLPCLLWALMNLGVTWDLQPFMPDIQAAQYKGAKWFPVYRQFLAGGLFIVSSDWAAVTMAWAVWRAGHGIEPERLKNLKALCWTCFAGSTNDVRMMVERATGMRPRN